MINYDIDQNRVNQAAEAMFELKLQGYTDGCQGHTLDLNHRHNQAYMQHYSLGIVCWLAELARREQEQYDAATLEF
jgi:hypothetical protein